mmetsp:Transcript_51745/g.155292  ORF Transcript_51745/g.155292 Transcript_51745/m.155292 type:complete len:255 (-) Transcript_51745:790-1554(-)
MVRRLFAFARMDLLFFFNSEGLTFFFSSEAFTFFLSSEAFTFFFSLLDRPFIADDTLSDPLVSDEHADELSSSSKMDVPENTELPAEPVPPSLPPPTPLPSHDDSEALVRSPREPRPRPPIMAGAGAGAGRMSFPLATRSATSGEIVPSAASARTIASGLKAEAVVVATPDAASEGGGVPPPPAPARQAAKASRVRFDVVATSSSPASDAPPFPPSISFARARHHAKATLSSRHPALAALETPPGAPSAFRPKA